MRKISKQEIEASLQDDNLRYVHCPVCVHEFQIRLEPGADITSACEVCGANIQHSRFLDRSGMMSREVEVF
jgi:translation initiation factor 2 beta subunit (eIF-2beta)/eIF-5